MIGEVRESQDGVTMGHIGDINDIIEPQKFIEKHYQDKIEASSKRSESQYNKQSETGA